MSKDCNILVNSPEGSLTSFICIAKIINFHGVRGELKIKSFTLPFSDIKNFTYFYIEEKITKILRIRHVKADIFIACLQGLDNKEEAQLLKGKEICIQSSDLPQLTKDEYYFNDLYNLQVASSINIDKIIGKIVGVFNFGAGEILEIKLDNVTNSFMILFCKDNVLQVCLEKNIIIIDQHCIQDMLCENKSNNGS